MLGSCDSAPSLMLVIGRSPSSQSCCCKAFLDHILERFEGQLLSDQFLFWRCFHKPAHWAWNISPPSVFRQVLLFQSMLLLTKYCPVFKVVSFGCFQVPPLLLKDQTACRPLNLPSFSKLGPTVQICDWVCVSAIFSAFDWVGNTESTAFLTVLSVFFGFPKCNTSCRAENEWEENEWKCFGSWRLGLSFV